MKKQSRRYSVVPLSSNRVRYIDHVNDTEKEFLKIGQYVYQQFQDGSNGQICEELKPLGPTLQINKQANLVNVVRAEAKRYWAKCDKYGFYRGAH